MGSVEVSCGRKTAAEPPPQTRAGDATHHPRSGIDHPAIGFSVTGREYLEIHRQGAVVTAARASGTLMNRSSCDVTP